MRLSCVTKTRCRRISVTIVTHATTAAANVMFPAAADAPRRPRSGGRSMANRPSRSTLIRALFGTGAACLILPGVSLVTSRDTATLGTALPALAIALAALAAGRRFARGRASWLGGVIVAGSAWLFSQARAGAMDWLLAAELGVGLALAWPRAVSPRDPLAAGTGLVAAAALAVLAWRAGAADAQTWGALCGLALADAALLDRADRTLARRRPGRAH